MTERTFVIIKPDAVAAGHVGNILNRYEEAGFRPEAMEMRTINGDFADQHYAEHLERPYYPPLREFMTEGPLVAMILTGRGALMGVRELNGATNPADAAGCLPAALPGSAGMARSAVGQRGAGKVRRTGQPLQAGSGRRFQPAQLPAGERPVRFLQRQRRPGVPVPGHPGQVGQVGLAQPGGDLRRRR